MLSAFMTARAANMEVNVVPMLAPRVLAKTTSGPCKKSVLLVEMENEGEITRISQVWQRVIGSILATGRTPMPTNGVNAEVVTELDCTIKVRATPSSMAK